MYGRDIMMFVRSECMYANVLFGTAVKTGVKTDIHDVTEHRVGTSLRTRNRYGSGFQFVGR